MTTPSNWTVWLDGGGLVCASEGTITEGIEPDARIGLDDKLRARNPLPIDVACEMIAVHENQQTLRKQLQYSGMQ